jgi:hypothetical protein
LATLAAISQPWLASCLDTVMTLMLNETYLLEWRF